MEYKLNSLRLGVNFTRALDIQQKDEVGELVQALNHMSQDLAAIVIDKINDLFILISYRDVSLISIRRFFR